ncbi:MAG: MFS transporter [Brevinematales bacterium]|nr:MFS transporter [Brevinematales bacterium]
MQNEKLSFKTKIGFGICDLGGNLFFTMMAFWVMNYFTDTLGLMPALAGFALMIGRIWDAVSDPLIGYMSDHTETRWGRRRPYIFIGAIFLFIFMLVMFKNPNITDQKILLWWTIIVLCLLFTAYTLTSVPYSSLTPELTTDYDERTTLNSFRMTFAIVGTFIAGGLAYPIIESFSKKIEINGVFKIDRSQGFFVMAIIFGLIMSISALITVFSVKEKISGKKIKTNFIKNFTGIIKNTPYLLVLFTYMFNMVAITLLSGSLVYYFKYVFKNEGLTTLSFIFLLVPTILSIPLWDKVSKIIGKKWAYFAGMSIIVFSLLINFIFGRFFGAAFFFIILVITGIGFSTGYVLPWAIIPDTIDYDYLNTGTKNEGIYYGAWTFFSKTGQSVANLLIGVILQIAGFLPNVEQSEKVIEAIRFILGPLGILFYLIAMLILFFYPIDRKMHDKILSDIREKNL